ncbi:helix-turn-helix transcriptional regulator [Anaeromicropila herbilytica]|uniref:HTH araC/xylS-type domain-containing protein n=1 Tax=Anaeromicropila herbilytica TaxID=2785025 RepID=A0A7R7IEC4_9FIRM|nr:helix-turn-helix transcriptional regulator [Anaeromicropila herbilytica]BCN30968.1 hypothetical protein bsdtb5_22630 [Anaeromicropila herbilytica]
MELLTKSKKKEWNRIIYLKVLENQDAMNCIKDQHTCKLILILEGHNVIQYNHKTLPIIAPAVICLNHKDAITFEEDQPCKLTVLFFQPTALNDQLKYNVFEPQFYESMEGTTIFQDITLLSSFYEIHQSKREITILDTASAVTLNQLLEKINNELTEQVDDYWPCRSRSYFIELLFFLESICQNNSMQNLSIVIDKNDNQLVHNIIHYFSKNIDKKITLSELEKRFACNRNQINQEFQKELGTTVMKYLIQMRMQLASILIRDTEIPIYEVALRVGYSDIGYFARTFKLYHGTTPSEYQSCV